MTLRNLLLRDRLAPVLLATAVVVPVLVAPDVIAADTPAPLVGASPSSAELMLKTLEDRLGGNPFDPVAMNNLAVVKLGENDPYAAAELLGRAYQLAADNPVIADNHTRLNAWLDARAKASKKKGEPVEDPSLPFPPEPPPLWQPR